VFSDAKCLCSSRVNPKKPFELLARSDSEMYVLIIVNYTKSKVMDYFSSM
jgi:hypothetical protein